MRSNSVELLTGQEQVSEVKLLLAPRNGLVRSNFAQLLNSQEQIVEVKFCSHLSTGQEQVCEVKLYQHAICKVCNSEVKLILSPVKRPGTCY